MHLCLRRFSVGGFRLLAKAGQNRRTTLVNPDGRRVEAVQDVGQTTVCFGVLRSDYRTSPRSTISSSA